MVEIDDEVSPVSCLANEPIVILSLHDELPLGIKVEIVKHT